ncbi:MAG: NifU family protein [Parcubacteria group bacterium]|nr:NifU family protein [Parcubacteria group bacterium]
MHRSPSLRRQVTEALDHLRPAVEAHGGSIELLGVHRGVVRVRLTGACEGCPLQSLTLHAGIEAYLIRKVSGVRKVKALP